MTNLDFTLNGTQESVPGRGNEMLQAILRQRGISSSRIACGVGVCGACTVSVNGKTVAACIYPAQLAQGADIVTVEGVGLDDPVIQAFSAERAFQCGYCTPGMVMECRALIEERACISLDDVRERLAGNLCRCGCYAAIETAALRAALMAHSGQDEEVHHGDE